MFHRNDRLGYAGDRPVAPAMARAGLRATLGAFIRSRRGAGAIQVAIAVPVLIALYAPAAGLVSARYDRFLADQAAAQTTQIAARYTDLYESDFAETLFPVAQGLAGRGVAGPGSAGRASACGVVISGIDMERGTPVVRWQKSQGSCAESRVGRVTTPPTLAVGYDRRGDRPLVVVEVLGDGPGKYAIAQAVPMQGLLPKAMPGSRF